LFSPSRNIPKPEPNLYCSSTSARTKKFIKKGITLQTNPSIIAAREHQERKNEKSGALEAIVANIKKLAGLRHQVQLAAEQAWPWRNPGVASIRKSFLLPIDRPMRE
jgi:hypothetical protein